MCCLLTPVCLIRLTNVRKIIDEQSKDQWLQIENLETLQPGE